jgi:hypothetical protein
MTLQIVPFRPEHLAEIEPRAHDVRLTQDLPDILERIPAYAAAGPAVTAFLNGTALCCGGVAMYWNGVGKGWLYTSTEVDRHRIAFHRGARGWIEQVVRAWGLRRLEVDVPVWNQMSCRWIERLGFQHESDMPLYGPDGSTWIRYVLKEAV